jgi:hypothetical protein
MNATPIVAIVVHELPVITDMTAQIAHVVTKNNVGSSNPNPYLIIVGTTPAAIHVVATIAINTSIGTAGNICLALRAKPTLRPRRLNAPVAMASKKAKNDVPSSTIWLYSDTA